jgi:Protein of unknown function, DUF547
MRSVIAIGLLALCVATPSLKAGQADPVNREKIDELLDLYVRDGYVYYRALKAERGKLDAFVASLAGASIESAPRNAQMAFWLNAYNMIVLRTVIDHYPIQQRTTTYPAHSIRQIPGAFERTQHRVAGRMITLDQIEQDVLSGFQDPRLYFALGRGAVGSGRLRSETFAPDAVERQLAETAAECANLAQCFEIDRTARRVMVSSIFSWRSAGFISTYAGSSSPSFASRSPIERAVLAFVEPKLLASEKELLLQTAFTVAFRPFDWALNDMTGRGGGGR